MELSLQPTTFPAQANRSCLQREENERTLPKYPGLPSQTSEAFVVGRGGTTERCELSAQPGASGAQFVPTT